jgi:tetratricopeptide (TPR) repeat protein
LQLTPLDFIGDFHQNARIKMADLNPPQRDRSAQTEAFMKRANELKSQGQWDAALTEYRRAALSDPSHFDAQLEMGRLFKEKAKRDRMFLRHSFEAFRSAARLNLRHQEAHEQYIMMAQQMNLLDDLLREYDHWLKSDPDSELLQRCKKNIVAISMALIPQQVNMGDTGASTAVKKLVFFCSVGGLLAGAGLMLAAPLLVRSGKVTKERLAPLVRVGLLCAGLGGAGLIVNSRLQ